MSAVAGGLLLSSRVLVMALLQSLEDEAGGVGPLGFELVDWLVGLLVGWLIGWLIGWSVGWLFGLFVC